LRLQLFHSSGHFIQTIAAGCAREKLEDQKKGTKKRGRPKVESGKGIANRVLRTAPPSWRAAQPLSLSRFLPPAASLSLHNLQCKLVDSSFSCPCCKESHELSPSMFVAASDVVLKVLGTLLIRCDKPNCSSVMGLKHFKTHYTTDPFTSTPVTSDCS
jgi:hypothetical protein